jgi:hypothetical protein
MSIEIEVYLILNDGTWTTGWWLIRSDDDDQEYVDWDSFDCKWDESGVIPAAVANRYEDMLAQGALAEDVEAVFIKWWNISYKEPS